MSTNGTTEQMCDKDLKAKLQMAASAAQHRCYSVADDFYAELFYPAMSMQCASTVLDIGIQFLKRCHSLDHEAYENIPKGTPFYWLGTAAFQTHDYQSAVYSYDAAVSEDIKAGKKPDDLSRSPAFSFILLDEQNRYQAARRLVQKAEQQVRCAVENYRDMCGAKPLTIDDLRKGFLQVALEHDNGALRSLATALISFFLEWKYRSTMLLLRGGEGTLEPFYVHLFKGCLLYESLLKVCPNRDPHCDPKPDCETSTLGKIVENPWYKKRLLPNNDSIGAKLIGRGHVTFQEVLGKLKCIDSNTIAALQIAYELRNTIGHNLGWKDKMCHAEYDQLFQIVSTSCLHTIACLYV